MKNLNIDKLRVSGSYDEMGFKIYLNEMEFRIGYPEKFMTDMAISLKEILLDHITVATTLHLPLVFHRPKISYSTAKPLLENHFLLNFLKDIPSCGDIDNISSDNLTREFLNLDINFTDNRIKLPSNTQYTGDSSVVAMSFGKDSLLSYAIADELGLKPEIAYIIEQSLTYEERHKRKLAEEFALEFGKQLHIIHHDTGKLRDYDYLGIPKSELGWGLQNTEYTLLLIPLAYKYKSRYIIFGNEQSTAINYFDSQNRWKIIPAFDQTHEWTVHLDAAAKLLSSNSVGVTSLIEPIMDMMIQRILVNRYPEIAKYQMSCFTEDETGRDYRWCHQCSVCAKMYLMCVGGGVDPNKVGFKQSMLTKSDKGYFTLFGGHSNLPYANTSIAHDEQLFAFYSAAKKGHRDPLIERFKISNLFQEAKEREEELMQKFCSIYPSISVPLELEAPLLSIYKEELATFEI